MPIYYIYLKADGSFQGNGTPYVDDDIFGSTMEPLPEGADPRTEKWFWLDGAWSLS